MPTATQRTPVQNATLTRYQSRSVKSSPCGGYRKFPLMHGYLVSRIESVIQTNRPVESSARKRSSDHTRMTIPGVFASARDYYAIANVKVCHALNIPRVPDSLAEFPDRLVPFILAFLVGKVGTVSMVASLLLGERLVRLRFPPQHMDMLGHNRCVHLAIHSRRQFVQPDVHEIAGEPGRSEIPDRLNPPAMHKRVRTNRLVVVAAVVTMNQD